MGIKISQVTQFGVYDLLRNLQKVKNRGHPELNQGPLDLQSNALPLSYKPSVDDHFAPIYKLTFQSDLVENFALVEALHAVFNQKE